MPGFWGGRASAVFTTTAEGAVKPEPDTEARLSQDRGVSASSAGKRSLSRGAGRTSERFGH